MKNPFSFYLAKSAYFLGFITVCLALIDLIGNFGKPLKIAIIILTMVCAFAQFCRNWWHASDHEEFPGGGTAIAFYSPFAWVAATVVYTTSLILFTH